MEGIPQKKFNSPQEEIAFLREQVATKERELLTRMPEGDPGATEVFAKEVLKDYASLRPEMLIPKSREIPEHTMHALSEHISTASEKVEEIMNVVHEHGIKNAFVLLEKIGNAHVTDEVHRKLVEEIRNGISVADLKENTPLWSVLHMSLFSVALPEHKEDGIDMELGKLMSAMEQLYSGLQTVGYGKGPSHYTLEIAVADNSDQIIFYISVPTNSVDLFEKQILSLFPHAVIALEQHDYNIFTDGGTSLASVATLKKHAIYPLRTYDTFTTDPLGVLLNAFSKIERQGGGAAIQLLIKTGGQHYHKDFEGIIKRVRSGEKTGVAIRKSTLGGEVFETFVSALSSSKKKDTVHETDTDALELFNEKIASPITSVQIRVVASAASEDRASQILGDIESSFHQFENTRGNTFVFRRQKGGALIDTLRAFSFREWGKHSTLPLSFKELATLVHVPSEGVESSPQFKQSRAKGASAPLDLPQHGTLLGVNSYRNVDTKVFVTPEDRLRHFYIIGQTGTGKTTLMKNMIVQDIEEGAGVCMIDPHGTDITDILGAIPPHRRDDVIYFDPARMDMVMGLNMLEYDVTKPEQKTFVVNELFSIFQKLYGGVPESMGPMFEQYFRNATLLVLEDPESGSTLLDISRVMADAEYRKMKLSKVKNPVVKQFWEEIAGKADGEAGLANIVPYITSKFDVFTANDFMRPIIGQQKSSFNFREVMDQKKILLVNLSKGRLGEINANLIGMIIVGKILMAALSRVDDVTKGFAPFYLHMDEFQNVTTDSIAAILSEARKYKLGLTIAHQFIAQIDEKIRDAVFGNVGSIAAFRVGPDDAATLEQQFAPVFTASDLMNIENRNAYVRILAGGTPTRPFNIKTMAPKAVSPDDIALVIDRSYAQYAKPRRKVEMEISARYQK